MRNLNLLLAFTILLVSCKKLDLERNNIHDEKSPNFVETLVIDTAFISTSSNGDSKLSPHEDFTLLVRVSNRSGLAYHNIKVEIVNTGLHDFSSSKTIDTLMPDSTSELSCSFLLNPYITSEKELSFQIRLIDEENRKFVKTVIIPIQEEEIKFSLQGVTDATDLSSCNQGSFSLHIKNSGDQVELPINVKVEAVNYSEYINAISLYYQQNSTNDEEYFRVNEIRNYRAFIYSKCSMPSGVNVTFKVMVHNPSGDDYVAGQFTRKTL